MSFVKCRSALQMESLSYTDDAISVSMIHFCVEGRGNLNQSVQVCMVRIYRHIVSNGTILFATIGIILIWTIYISHNKIKCIYIYIHVPSRAKLSGGDFSRRLVGHFRTRPSTLELAGSSSIAWRATSPVSNRRVDESCVPDTTCPAGSSSRAKYGSDRSLAPRNYVLP